jgi:hypothetical protein
LVLKDPLLDSQVLRAAGSAPYGGADIGECITTARRVKPGDLDSWHAEWVATADASAELARRAETCGDRDTARLAYLRASTYYRTAGIMLLRPPLDPRLEDANAKQTEMFRRAGALMDRPPELLEIPYEQVSLPGYFLRTADDGQPRATVILTGGYDSTVEELYLTNGAAALARGYNVLAFDGPGQGGALIQQHLMLRPDWENVIGPVVDYALTRADVSPHPNCSPTSHRSRRSHPLPRAVVQLARRAPATTHHRHQRSGGRIPRRRQASAVIESPLRAPAGPCQRLLPWRHCRSRPRAGRLPARRHRQGRRTGPTTAPAARG